MNLSWSISKNDCATFTTFTNFTGRLIHLTPDLYTKNSCARITSLEQLPDTMVKKSSYVKIVDRPKVKL